MFWRRNVCNDSETQFLRQVTEGSELFLPKTLFSLSASAEFAPWYPCSPIQPGGGMQMNNSLGIPGGGAGVSLADQGISSGP
jgi:hypothetical protein